MPSSSAGDIAMRSCGRRDGLVSTRSLAVVRQLLAAGDAPELEQQRISSGIGIRIDLDDRGGVREPVGVCVACIARGSSSRRKPQRCASCCGRCRWRCQASRYSGLRRRYSHASAGPSRCRYVQVGGAGMPAHRAYSHGETSLQRIDCHGMRHGPAFYGMTGVIRSNQMRVFIRSRHSVKQWFSQSQFHRHWCRRIVVPWVL